MMNKEKLVKIKIYSIVLEGILNLPKKAKGVVIFAHGSGSGRFSPRNNFVAGVLQKAGLGTLLFDLLTEEEDTIYENRFNIDLRLLQHCSQLQRLEWILLSQEVAGQI